MGTESDKAIQLLKEKDIKPSFQRIKVLEYLMNDQEHPTADTIYRKLLDEVPTLSKATVYNTLNLFLEKGLVSPMSVDHHEIRFDVVTEDHGHFVCSKCGRVYNFPYQASNKYTGLDDFEIDDVEIVLKGLCKYCK